MLPYNLDNIDRCLPLYENVEIDIKITKKLLDYNPDYAYNITKNIYLSNYDNFDDNTFYNMSSFIYIINEYKEWDIENIVSMLKEYTRSNFLYIKFKMIIEQFYDLLKPKLVNIYIKLIDSSCDKEYKRDKNRQIHYKIIGFLANLEPVKSYVMSH